MVTPTSIEIRTIGLRSGDSILAKKEKPPMTVCPVATMVGLIDSKWKMLILRNLLSEPNRFSDFKRTIPGISSKVLTESLRGLEGTG